jgi:hypothetical protein
MTTYRLAVGLRWNPVRAVQSSNLINEKTP